MTHLARILAPFSSSRGPQSDIDIIRYKGQAKVVEKLHAIEKGGLPPFACFVKQVTTGTSV